MYFTKSVSNGAIPAYAGLLGLFRIKYFLVPGITSKPKNYVWHFRVPTSTLKTYTMMLLKQKRTYNALKAVLHVFFDSRI